MIEGLVVVSDWGKTAADKRLHSLVDGISPAHSKEFRVGNAHSSASFEELFERYGDKVIQKVRKEGEKVNANIAFIYSTRGFGELVITAHYFFLN